jgi:hypothetical protein
MIAKSLIRCGSVTCPKLLLKLRRPPKLGQPAASHPCHLAQSAPAAVAVLCLHVCHVILKRLLQALIGVARLDLVMQHELQRCSAHAGASSSPLMLQKATATQISRNCKQG